MPGSVASGTHYICLFHVRFPEDDMKEIETCQKINEWIVCESVHFNACSLACIIC